MTVQNHTKAPIQLVISNSAMEPGEQIGSATPQIVPAFDFAHVTLVVPGSRSWALFVLGADPRPRRVLRDEQLGGCRTFKIPIEVEVSVQGGSTHPPADNC